MASSKRKINIRNAAVTSIEKLVTEFEELNVSTDNTERIIAIRDTLQQKLNKVNELNNEILDLIDEDNIAEEDEKATTFQIFANQNLRAINKFISDKEETISTVSSNSSRLIRLPKLNLKPFDGQPENWHEFWDTFTHAVHENESISDVQKMTYLKNLVSGTAAQTIAGFKISSVNYAQALQLLKERYENKHVQISVHMNRLLEISPIDDMNKVEELRELYNTIEIQMRSLLNLGIEDKMYGPFLIPVLQRKIPNELNLIFSRYFHSRDSWDIKELLEQFKVELMAREKAVSQHSTENNELFTASSLLSGAHNRSKKSEKQALVCVFCEQSHKPQHCKNVTELQARKAILREKGKCFRCLRSGHLSSRCSSRIKCFNCSKTHHAAVCEGERTQTTPEVTSSMHTSSSSSASVLLQTARAPVFTENKQEQRISRILFDGGSQFSYISKELRHELKLKTIERNEVIIKAFGKTSSKEIMEKVRLNIKTIDDRMISIECYVKDICYPLTGQNTVLAAEKYKHLRNLNLADPNYGTSHIDILVGSDYYWSFVTNDIIRGPSDDAPVAIKTNLGFILSGPADVIDNKTPSSSVLISHVLKCQAEIINPNEILHEHLDNFWNSETLSQCENDPEFDVQKSFRDDLHYDWEEGRYAVKLPVKEQHDLLPDNYSNSLKRLKGLTKRFEKDHELMNNYHNIVKEQLKSGIIETVPHNEHKPVGQVHYLPHRPVIRNDKETTKIRMVFDASAKTNGLSLNDCLHTGPSLTESLYGVLLRFRLFKYVFTADIEKAFHQILLAADHKDLVRFLWYDTSQDIDIDQLDSMPVQAFRFCRILFGLRPSPFILSATLIEHFQQIPDPLFVEKILKSLQVDDLVAGGDTESETFQFYHDAKEHLSLANFNLRKFHSNSDTLNRMVYDVNEHSRGPKSKVLGLSWESVEDKLFFEFDHLHHLAVVHPTKREFLSFMASIYDPLGLLNPFVVKLKILFQNVCSLKSAWDDLIDDSSLRVWSTIRDDFLATGPVKFCRWVRSLKEVDRIELHGFCDASLQAYGGCVYIKIYHNHEVFVSLLTAKSRVTPTTPKTIPKLELMSAALLVSLLDRVHKEISSFISVDDCFYWTDSMVALHWISDHKSQSAFVRRRVDSIRSVCSPHHWFHIDSKLNPADILSRGVSLSHLVEEDLWRHGPHFLNSLNDYSQFSLNSKLAASTLLAAEEIEEERRVVVPDRTLPNTFNIIDIERFNDLNKLYRVLAYVRRFISNIRRKIDGDPLITSHLSTSEISQSQEVMILSSQRDVPFGQNYKQLKLDLGLYTDEKNVTRCRGRLENSQLPFDAKFPVFLPKSKFAMLIVQSVHKRVKHNGLKETLNELRTQFWIPKARTFIKKVIGNCYVCKLLESKPYAYPVAPDLPSSRVSINPPFTHIGLDYAGPVYVKSIYSSSTNSFKAWIVLYTCHATRAVCLDLVPSYDADSCIRTLRRFFSRRGVPTSILSDNGSNFTADETQAFASDHGVHWTFNPPASPWWGGVFERLVRSTKRCIKKVLLKAKLTFKAADNLDI